MEISQSPVLAGEQDPTQKTGNGPKADQLTQDFGQALEESLRNVDNKLKSASQTQQDVAAGGETSLHEAMVAGQKANLSMRFVLQIRNKAMEAYQEIMRMQV
ncbi:MAG: flagellar hook-basal body complex protein FliE [Desulfovermiculus sp.]